MPIISSFGQHNCYMYFFHCNRYCYSHYVSLTPAETAEIFLYISLWIIFPLSGHVTHTYTGIYLSIYLNALFDKDINPLL